MVYMMRVGLPVDGGGGRSVFLGAVARRGLETAPTGLCSDRDLEVAPAKQREGEDWWEGRPRPDSGCGRAGNL